GSPGASPPLERPASRCACGRGDVARAISQSLPAGDEPIQRDSHTSGVRLIAAPFATHELLLTVPRHFRPQSVHGYQAAEPPGPTQLEPPQARFVVKRKD